MTEFDPERFEAELQALRPGKPSPHMLRQIRGELIKNSTRHETPKPATLPTVRWSSILRGLAPATAAVGVAILLLLHFHHLPSKTAMEFGHAASPSDRPVLKADKVEIDRQFVAGFDAVTELPDGQPFRFRCEQWLDKVRLRDTAAGLVIERTTPRVEIVPVRFDTY